MSNKTEEALRREVRDAFFNPTLGLHRSVDILDHPNVRKAFDALRDHYQAQPTFEGDEAAVRRWLTSWTMDANKVSGLKALALLDAKDERLASAAKWNDLYANARDAALSRAEQAEAEISGAGRANDQYRHERDAALSRAEQAEAALAERDAAIVGLMDCLIETVGTPRVEALHGKRLDAAYDAAKTFLPAPEPAVDPLVVVWAEAFPGDPQGTRERHVSMIRAAIERAGGVKAVFGEGV